MRPSPSAPPARRMSDNKLARSSSHDDGVRAMSSRAVGASLGNGSTLKTNHFVMASRAMGTFFDLHGNSPSPMRNASAQCASICGAVSLPHCPTASGASRSIRSIIASRWEVFARVGMLHYSVSPLPQPALPCRNHASDSFRLHSRFLLPHPLARRRPQESRHPHKPRLNAVLAP